MCQTARVEAVKVMAAVFSVGLMMSAVSTSLHAESARTATQTTLTTETREVNGRTIMTAALTVLPETDTPATGAVILLDGDKSIAGAALSPDGKANFTVSGLTAGNHSLKAIYKGDSLHEPSTSDSADVVAEATSGNSEFMLTISTGSLTLAAPGDTGSLVATVTPVNGSGFTGFLSLSCSGPPVTSGAPGGSALPFGVTCTFSPANLEVTSPTVAQSANLSIQSTAPSGTQSKNQPLDGMRGKTGTLVVAVLLPGIFGLGVLGRKRGILGKAALLLTFAAITILGTSACSPRYGYFHHPPTYNPGTSPGTYTITVTAQTSNGVTAAEDSQSLALTVK